ncbi:hypothetical protein D6810_03385 [Candidatus Dojkabacteria bacterium]|uniref:Uncharacterized protein n=1 Tax=Candidatus Dojkabacteria bacterium TaxID=2099670 RepID=A0A3M0YZB0_9BACT|nr:MAG: hypothetical protein D6810_03385 [Candidatus Dojkabacteria bacterium]
MDELELTKEIGEAPNFKGFTLALQRIDLFSGSLSEDVSDVGKLEEIIKNEVIRNRNNLSLILLSEPLRDLSEAELQGATFKIVLHKLLSVSLIELYLGREISTLSDLYEAYILNTDGLTAFISHLQSLRSLLIKHINSKPEGLEKFCSTEGKERPYTTQEILGMGAEMLQIVSYTEEEVEKIINHCCDQVINHNNTWKAIEKMIKERNNDLDVISQARKILNMEIRSAFTFVSKFFTDPHSTPCQFPPIITQDGKRGIGFVSSTGDIEFNFDGEVFCREDALSIAVMIGGATIFIPYLELNRDQDQDQERLTIKVAISPGCPIRRFLRPKGNT